MTHLLSILKKQKTKNILKIGKRLFIIVKSPVPGFLKQDVHDMHDVQARQCLTSGFYSRGSASRYFKNRTFPEPGHWSRVSSTG